MVTGDVVPPTYLIYQEANVPDLGCDSLSPVRRVLNQSAIYNGLMIKTLPRLSFYQLLSSHWCMTLFLMEDEASLISGISQIL